MLNVYKNLADVLNEKRPEGHGVLTDRDYAIFTRYKNGEIITPEDKSIVYRYVLTGKMKLGLVEKVDGIYETAILTPLGKRIQRRERIFRNPIKKFFYTLWVLTES